MNELRYLFVLCCLAINSYAQSFLTFHDFSDTAISGNTVINMGQYYGKKVMVVNTASYCAYTPQFTELEQLYTQYKQNNFEIIGFPCNDFGQQDPNSDSLINDFCTNNYNVTFQMMSKVYVVTGDTAPVFKWLQRVDLNGVQNAPVSWNFNKFLIDEAGHWVKHYASGLSPLDTAISNWIMSASVLSNISNTTSIDEMIELKSANPTSSTIEFMVKTSAPQHFSIDIYSIEGKFISNLYDGICTGAQNINCSVSSLSSGIYFVKIESEGAHKTIRLAIVR